MPLPTPSGKTETVLDYLQRGEYASAGVAEFLKGLSPYDNIFEAAWKGLSGQRRMNYMELTGNIPLGLVMGIALDPITWLPAGALAKMVKMTGIPKAVGLASLKMAEKFPAYANAVRAGRFAASKFTGGSFSKFRYLEKYDEAMDVLKLHGVGEDVISGIAEGVVAKGRGTLNILKSNGMLDELAGMGFDSKTMLGVAYGKYGVDDLAGGLLDAQYKRLNDIIKVRDAAGKISNLNKVTRLAGVVEGARTRDRLELIDDALKKAQKLHKMGDEAQYKITNIVEKAQVVPGEKGFWVLSGDTIKMFEKSGISREFMDTVIGKEGGKKALKLIKVAGGQRALDLGIEDLAPRIGHTVAYMDKPLIHEMPEFIPLLEKMVTNMDPTLKGLGNQYGYIYGVLTAKAQELGILPREMMQKFANTIGLSHLPHNSLGANIKFLQERGAIIRTSFLSRADETIGAYRTTLLSKGLRPELVDAQVIKFKDAIQKIANATLKDAIEGTDPMMKFMAEAARLSKEFPEVDSAVRLFGQKIKEMHSFREVMGTLNEINTIAGKKVFETNFAQMMFDYELRIKTAMHMHNFITETSRIMPDMMKPWKHGSIIPEGFVKYSDPTLGKFLVNGKHKETVDLLLGMSTGKSGEWNKFLQMFDKGTGIWKYTTLIPFGKFHLRNLVSEMMLGALGGMPIYSPEYAKAGKLWLAAKRGEPWAVKEYIEYAAKKVVGKGFQQSEIGAAGKLIGTDIVSKFKRKVPLAGPWLKGMESAGTFVEDVPRIAQYMYGQKKGAAWLAKRGFKGDNALVKYVRKFHPVYDEFTQFEQKVMRRVMPFYSWSRFNLPLHAEMFLHNPRAYVRLDKYRRGITEAVGGELPEDFTPEWIKNSVVIGMSAKPGKRNYIVMKGVHPATDLLDLISPSLAKHKFESMLHPLKVIPEIIWGQDRFKGRKMPAYPGQKVTYFGARIDPRIAHFLDSFRILNETNRFLCGSDDPTLNRIMYHLIGKNYEMDVKGMKKATYYYLKKKVIGGDEGIDVGISRARREGDMKTVKRLTEAKRKYEEIAKKYKP